MEEKNEDGTNVNKVPDSPKPMAFTIDFGSSKSIDTQRHKILAEKFQSRHRRGQSLSKLDDSPAKIAPTVNKKHPLSGNLPRKTNLQSEARSEGYFSCDEKTDDKVINNVMVESVGLNNLKLRGGLSLPLKNVNSDKMTQSCTLPSSRSPDIELRDVITPDLDLVSPFSPQTKTPTNINTVTHRNKMFLRQFSSPESDTPDVEETKFIDGKEFDFDKSDTVSDAGTYTLDADNYSEEQKERMSIDREFKIEEVTDHKKTLEYVQSLSTMFESQKLRNITEVIAQKPQTLPLAQTHKLKNSFEPRCKLSPILSPTQNMSITQNHEVDDLRMNNDESNSKMFTKIMFPSPKAKIGICASKTIDQGSIISVTSSGVFRSKKDKMKHTRHLSLTKSEVQIEVYTDSSMNMQKPAENKPNLSANLVLVSENIPKPSANYTNGCQDGTSNVGKIMNLPPTIGGCSGKVSPTKIPSPMHTSRPRSRNSSSSLNIDLSDSSLETESYLKPTQNLLNSLEQRLSLENNYESERDPKYLNNDARNLLKKATHMRHNSLDERNLKMSNKLEHFQNKNFIDQTYTNVLNQYSQKVHKIQNSPNNSPIRRSSSFSTKNQINTKCSNIPQKESNITIRHSPNITRNGSIQRSSSTASVRPNIFLRRSSINSDQDKIDRSHYGDTESSSEDDFDKQLSKKNDITNTRYNRAFSLRRARLDEPAPAPKCPNTPEMRRKFQPDIRGDRSFSVDRKPSKAALEVQSRYLLNVTKSKNATPSPPQPMPNKVEAKGSPKVGNIATKPAPKPQVFSRTDTGRFSMRTVSKPPVTNGPKNSRKDIGKKPSGPRSNSSLTSKEQEFQMWKRRKSYDPMKAAAEGKQRKAELAKRVTQNPMTQSYHEGNQDCDDSSPSHSSSVHRSQSFHGTAALEQLLSSEEDDDLTLSADEGFSPPTPSPRELSPNLVNLRYAWKDELH